MFARLLLLLVAVPLVELALLLQLARWTSPLFTIGLVILTGVIGAALARRQGLSTFQTIQQELADGRLPSRALADALMILVAGALLITPGVLTDLFGLSLLVPPVRALYRVWLVRYVGTHFQFRHESFARSASPDRDSYVVDGSSTPVDDDMRR